MSDVSISGPLADGLAGPSGSLSQRGLATGQTAPVSLSAVSLIARAVDCAFLITLGLAVRWLYDTGEQDIAIQYWLAIPGVATLTIWMAGLFHAYRGASLKSLLVSIPSVLAAWIIALLVLLTIAFFLRAGSDFSRLWLGLWFVSGSAGLVASRLVWRARITALANSGRLDRNAVIVGGGDSAIRLIRALETSRTAGIRIVGLFDDRGHDRSAVAHYPTLGSFDDLVAFARTSRVDLLIIALPMTAEARLMHLLKKLWVLPVDIRVSALSSRLRFRPRAYSYIGDVPFLDIFDKPLSASGAIAKTVFDRVIGVLALIALSPVMAAVALAVKVTSPGPVLFRQKRYGFNNELIEVYKFRSMYSEQSDANATRLVTRGDPRVTPLGRFIRKTSLDELPQLFNVVFKGNLSLVGPRPHAVHAKAADALYQDVVDGYYARHKMKPGITGWAQINGWRGETDTPEKIQRRVECDLHYIENWSILRDAYILMMTPISLISKSEAAY